jgi:hypothetical protein
MGAEIWQLLPPQRRLRQCPLPGAYPARSPEAFRRASRPGPISMQTHGGNSTLEKWQKYPRRAATKASLDQGRPRGMSKITDADGILFIQAIGSDPQANPSKGCFFDKVVVHSLRPGNSLTYAKASGTASSHRPCAFKISSMTSRAAPLPARRCVI